jgi:YegS/Rv2252/BmrU family lipid kinase
MVLWEQSMIGQKAKFIVNPSADKGRTRLTVADLQPTMKDFDGVDWSETTSPTHATEIAQQAAEAGYTLVIAVGGDGTVHEVVNGLMQVSQEIRPRLGIVPLGSGNDFAYTIGIHSDPAEALRQVFSGQPKRMDVGAFETGNGKRQYFNNTFGMGFDATVTIRTLRLTKIRGFMMYLVAVLQTIALNHDAPMMHIQTDLETWHDETIMLVVCNGPREGGGFLVAPESEPSDGILNYAAIGHVSRLKMLRLVPEVMKGTHGRFKEVKLGQLHRLQLQADKPITIHADGEVISGFDTDVRNVTVEVVPGALEVMI